MDHCLMETMMKKSSKDSFSMRSMHGGLEGKSRKKRMSSRPKLKR